jgi:hypothetical protein
MPVEDTMTRYVLLCCHFIIRRKPEFEVGVIIANFLYGPEIMIYGNRRRNNMKIY